MSCGAIDRLSPCEHDGSVARRSCGDQSPAQEQELVRRWRQIRAGLLDTRLVPYGVASFSNFPPGGTIGPPHPGNTGTTLTIRDIPVDPLPSPSASPTPPDAQ